ncbi:MAG: YCF48-related protein [Candidatus Bathyarchaeota archaeon]|nr:YCF48-related protein [Candidatus Bathyarchaeota archaeon]
MSSPEEPLWVETNGPPGGSFGLIEFNPGNPDIMYAGSGYTFFRSEDGGDTWTRVHQLHALTETLELGVRALEFDPRDPDILYLGCRGGMFKSTDSGVTWTSKTGGLEGIGVQAITVDPLDPDIVYFLASYGGDENYVYKSLNGGDRWTDISSSLPSTREMSMLKAVRHDELYSGGGFEMARDGDLYHSTDGGATWEVRDIGQGEDTFPGHVRIDPHDEDHIYIGFADAYNRGRRLEELLFESFDGGETWQPVSHGQIGSGISDLEISKSNPDLIYYLSPLHRSTDGGQTWEQVHTWNHVEDFGNVEQNSITIHPTDEDTLFATLMGQGIAKSTDRGKTWWLSTTGMVSTFVTNVATDPVDPDTVYVSGGDGSGTWKTTDGGETWEVLNKGGIHHPWVDELTIVPSDPNIIYDIADIGLIYKSEDAGETWENWNNGFHHESVYAIEVDPVDPDVIYVMNNGFGMFKTVDGGDGWHYLLYSPDYSYTIAIDPSDTSIVYSGYNRKVFENASRVYKSTSAGEDWEVVLEIPDSEAVTSVAIDQQDPDRIYAGATGASGEIYFSDDKGQTWATLNDLFTFSTIHAQNQLAVSPTDENTVYATPWGAGLYKTTDAGATWVELKNAPTVSIASITIDPTDTDNVYIADRTQAILYGSDDGGQTFEEVFDAGPMYSRLMKVKLDPGDPGTIYVSAFRHNAIMGSLFRIRDGETSDITGSIPRAIIDIAIDPGDPETIYVSLHGENVYKTEDGGENWENLENLPLTGVFDIEIDPSDTDVLYTAAIAGRRCPPELLYPEFFPPVEPEAIGGHGVYKSVDGGLTWESINRDVLSKPFRALAVHPENPRVIYAGAANGIYVTTDGGETWAAQNVGLDYRSIGALDISGDTIYAGTRGGGVYVGTISEDYTVEWAATSGPVPRIHNIQLLVDPTDSDVIYASSYPGGMFKSTDRGVTWKDKNFFMPSFEVEDTLRQGYYKFVMDPDDPQRLVFGIYGEGVYVSNDGADSQMPLFGDMNEMRGANVTTVAVDPEDSDTIYAATAEGVYVTRDGGRSWDPINGGLIVDDIMTLAFTGDGVLFAGSKGYGVYTLRDGGDSWDGPFKVENYGVFWHVWDRPLYLYNALLVNPFDPGIMYLGTFPTGFYRTLDGGLTWREINTNFTIDGAFSMSFHPYNKSVIFAGTYNGVSRSDDSGETWRRWDRGMPQELWVFSIVFNPLNPDIVYAAAKNGENMGTGREDFRGTVLKSTDGGANWVEIANGLHLWNEYYQLVMYPYNYDVLFVSSGQGVYMTEDAGGSWTMINGGLEVSGGMVGSGIVNNVANNLALDAEGRFLYLGTMARGVFKADLEKLDLERDPEALPLSCFNYVQDGDETGVDTGGSCVVADGEYDYGLAIKLTAMEPPDAHEPEPETPEGPSETNGASDEPDETGEPPAEEPGASEEPPEDEELPPESEETPSEEPDTTGDGGEEEPPEPGLPYPTVVLGLVLVITLLVIAYIRK